MTQVCLETGSGNSSWTASLSFIGLLKPLLTWGVTALALFAFVFLPGDQPERNGRAMFPVCDDLSGSSTIVRADTKPAGDVQAPYVGMWISQGELAALPTSGPAWEALKAAADRDAGQPNISDQNENNDVYVLAKALVYARTGQQQYRAQVLDNLTQVIGTEKGGRTLALGRNLTSYVIAADLVNLPADASQDASFRDWLKVIMDEDLEKKSLRSTQEERPNNWGTHAGAARVAVDLYLGDKADLKRAAAVFQGYLGDRSAYAGFRYGDDLSWQCDSNSPIGINPHGCVKDGHLIDGALPEEMRRGTSFQWPPAETGYAWEGLQGALVTAELLSRAGYPAWEWQDHALLRAVNFLYSIDWKPQKDDAGFAWLINHAYGTNFYAASPAQPGKNIGWMDWTHARPADNNGNSGTGGRSPGGGCH